MFHIMKFALEFILIMVSNYGIMTKACEKNLVSSDLCFSKLWLSNIVEFFVVKYEYYCGAKVCSNVLFVCNRYDNKEQWEWFRGILVVLERKTSLIEGISLKGA